MILGPLSRHVWIAATVSILALAWVVYFGYLHPWFMNWGATPAEQQMALPGDQLLPFVSSRFTRAITIHAPPSAIWPWILQIGQDRAGFYSNTWLENLTGSDIHNVNIVHAEWQQRELGNRVLLARPDLLGGFFAEGAQTRIVALEAERLIAFIPTRFVLLPVDAQTTRLLLRESVPASFAARFTNAPLWDAMHFVMQQRMLRGIKERAEGQPLVPGPLLLLARIGWTLAGFTLLAAFLAQRDKRLWVLLPVLLMLPVVLSTGDWDAALAGFLAIGITVLGRLMLGRRWWPPYLLLAAAVALMLLLSPDPYTAFGISFGVLGLSALLTFLIAARRDGAGRPPRWRGAGRA